MENTRSHKVNMRESTGSLQAVKFVATQLLWEDWENVGILISVIVQHLLCGIPAFEFDLYQLLKFYRVSLSILLNGKCCLDKFLFAFMYRKSPSTNSSREQLIFA